MFDRETAGLICDALNGFVFVYDKEVPADEQLLREVMDGIEQRSLDNKWDVCVEDLRQELSEMGELEARDVIEKVQLVWSGSEFRSMTDRLLDVGLIEDNRRRGGF